MMYHCVECDTFFHESMQYYEHKRDRHSKLTCIYCDAVFLARRELCRHKQSCAKVRYNWKNREARKNNLLPMKTAEKFVDKLKNGYGKSQCTLKSSETNSVSCKSDFMNLIGLTLKERTTSIYRGVTSTRRDKLLDKMKRCRVIIIGEHCKICSQFFKCNTDLVSHISKHHVVDKNDAVVVVLKIGKEVLAKIRLKKRYLRPNAGVFRRLRPGHFYKQADNAHADNEYAANDEQGRNNAEPVSAVFLNNDPSSDDESMCRPVLHEKCTGIVESRRNDAYCLSGDIRNASFTGGDRIRSQDASKEVVVLEDDVETPPENFGSLDSNYNSGDEGYHEWARIYDEELVPNPLFSPLTMDKAESINCEKENDNSDDDVVSCYSNATTVMWEDLKSDNEIPEVKERMPFHFEKKMSTCSISPNHGMLDELYYSKLSGIIYTKYHVPTIEGRNEAFNDKNCHDQNMHIDGGLDGFLHRVFPNRLDIADEERQMTSVRDRFQPRMWFVPCEKERQIRCGATPDSDSGSAEDTIYRHSQVIIKEELMLEDYTYYANDIKYCDV